MNISEIDINVGHGYSLNDQYLMTIKIESTFDNHRVISNSKINNERHVDSITSDELITNLGTKMWVTRIDQWSIWALERLWFGPKAQPNLLILGFSHHELG